MKTRLSLLLATLCAASLAAQDGSAIKSADEITKQIVVEGRVAFAQKSLPFKLDSTELANDDANRQLIEIARALQSPELQNARFSLEGHTCDLGSDAHNLGLSQRRAVAIKALLLRAGIDGSRLITDGLGETKPAVPNTSEGNRAQNRRVELRLINR
jgi:OOP family OmpA-OmpF porin